MLSVISSKSPLVSVVMPAYNCERYVKQAIDSIINQTYENWELLVSDDCSNDKTRKIIDSYKDQRIKCYHNSINMGYLKTWNKLIALSRGEFITFQDADDWSSPNRIEIMLEFLCANPKIDVCGSNCFRVDVRGNIVADLSFPKNHDAIFQAMPKHFFFVGSALMIKRIVYKTIGGYNVFFDRIGAEDLYWAYLIMEKYQMGNIPQVLYYYRNNPNSLSGNMANNPSKINIGNIISFLIEDRKNRNTDYLQEGKIVELHQMLTNLNKPFLDDVSYYYYYVAKRSFYEGKKIVALKLMCRAILKRPFKWSYYKDLHYFYTHRDSSNE